MRIFVIALLCSLPFAASLAQETAQTRVILLVDEAAQACTTLIRQRELEEAAEACDDAVDLAKVPVTTSMNPYGHFDREALAVAYSNRAVLHWLNGDLEAADADIARALRQNRHVDNIRHNQKLVTNSYLASRK